MELQQKYEMISLSFIFASFSITVNMEDQKAKS